MFILQNISWKPLLLSSATLACNFLLPVAFGAQPQPIATSGPVLAVSLQSLLRTPLQALVRHSPVILSGEVLPADATVAANGSLRITRIRVDSALRGVEPGAVFLFTQWQGSDAAPLYPHERVILFLHQPNAAGVTSSTFGVAGLLRIGGGDLVDLAPLQWIAQRQRDATVDSASRELLPAGDAEAAGFRGLPRNECHESLAVRQTSHAEAILPSACLPVTPRRIAAGPVELSSMPAAELLETIAELVRRQPAAVEPTDAH